MFNTCANPKVNKLTLAKLLGQCYNVVITLQPLLYFQQLALKL